jgi:hypothetical protein
LLRKEQSQKAAAEEDSPEEEGCRKDGGIVGCEHEMVEEKCQSEVEDEPRPTDKVVKIIDTTRRGVVS